MERTPPGNHGRLMLPWFEPEIIPNITTPGVRRLNLDEHDADANCRALVEAQILAMRRHADWMKTRPTSITVTGGASEDPTVLQVIADIFQCPVQRTALTDGAATGAALLATHPFLNHTEWKNTVATFVAHDRPAPMLPNPATAPVYDALLTAYTAFETRESIR
jgi:xylulokinase